MTEFPHDFPDDLPDDALADPADGSDIEFMPVARQRRRRGGWTPEKQRSFINLLSRCGSVASAARAVGLTPRSAYRLADAPDAASFARAWGIAVENGIARVRMDALRRALDGDYVPIYRRSKLVRVEHRYNDRLAVALIAGRGDTDLLTCERLRTDPLLRHEHRADLKLVDAAAATRKQAVEEAQAAYQTVVDRIVAGIIERGDYGPRIRSL